MAAPTGPRRDAARVPLDPALCMVVTAVTPLRWSEPAPPDLPSVVRAGSALRRWQGRWVVVQDDVRAFAAADEDGGARAWPMPPAPGGGRTFDALRGNKAAKPDFEAAAVLPDGRLVAFGSGTKSPRRCLAIADAPGRIRMHPADALYAALADALDGARPNVEGAIVVGDVLRLFQRGTGTAPLAADAPPPNATLDLDLEAVLAWLAGARGAPRVHALRRYDLGTRDGVTVGFTDAAVAADGRVAFLACAEATDDPVADGAVLAQRFGWLTDDGARQGEVVGADGRPLTLKLEGLEPVPGEPGAWHAVSDADDPEAAALMVRLEPGRR